MSAFLLLLAVPALALAAYVLGAWLLSRLLPVPDATGAAPAAPRSGAGDLAAGDRLGRELKLLKRRILDQVLRHPGRYSLEQISRRLAWLPGAETELEASFLRRDQQLRLSMGRAMCRRLLEERRLAEADGRLYPADDPPAVASRLRPAPDPGRLRVALPLPGEDAEPIRLPGSRLHEGSPCN